jgi:hypothetical protein
MLHDPSRYEPPAPAEPILLCGFDKTVLRTLAEQVAAVAAHPIHVHKTELWRRLNDMDPVRPLVWIQLNHGLDGPIKQAHSEATDRPPTRFSSLPARNRSKKATLICGTVARSPATTTSK